MFCLDLSLYDAEIAQKTILQARKLGPVGIQTKSDQSYPKFPIQMIHPIPLPDFN
jgi:hypothetical protein